jgi:hypothetical protein
MARCVGDAGGEVFLDVFDIQTGDDFKARIRDQIIKSEELVVLLTPFSRRRNWLWSEVGFAWGLGKRVVPITFGMTVADLDGDDGGGRGVLETTHFRDLNDFDAYLHELRERV